MCLKHLTQQPRYYRNHYIDRGSAFKHTDPAGRFHFMLAQYTMDRRPYFLRHHILLRCPSLKYAGFHNTSFPSTDPKSLRLILCPSITFLSLYYLTLLCILSFLLYTATVFLAFQCHALDPRSLRTSQKSGRELPSLFKTLHSATKAAAHGLGSWP
ncbi:hypothetical protein F5B17DRAFT_45732 [Nemania serpens]|nr:hypothetical protein F5B17DRAFT_45732 [Nemania serpens]